MPDNRTIRHCAGDYVKGNFSFCVGFTLILLALNGLRSLLFEQLARPILGNLFGPLMEFAVVVLLQLSFDTFLYMPFMLGVMRWCYALVFEEKFPFSEWFYYFSAPHLYARGVQFSLLYSAFFTLLQDVSQLPKVIWQQMHLSKMASMTQGEYLAVKQTESLLNIISLFGIVLALIFVLIFFLSPYLLISEPSLSPVSCLKKSAGLMRHRKGDTLWYLLGYTGWILLAVFIIPIVYILPMMLIGNAIYAKCILEKEKIGEKSI